MGIALDPENHWRSAAFIGIPVKRVGVVIPTRKSASGPIEADAGVTSRNTQRWHDGTSRLRVGEEDARLSMVTGHLGARIEVGTAGAPIADGAVGVQYALPYSYGPDNATNVRMTHSGRHFQVRPQLNETVVAAMYRAATADEWAKAANIKLPRVVNATQVQSVIEGAGAVDTGGSNVIKFEALRRQVAQCAKSDDYGDRLHALARVVCHSCVYAATRRKHEVTGPMSWGNMRSVLSAVVTDLTVRELRENTYHYVHTDNSAEYRAFLAMGARGLQHYVGRRGSAYSACVTEAEATEDSRLVFVRVGGELDSGDVAPAPEHYITVLDNPELALAYYNAYALSMGLGETAAAVLVQTAVAPHVWGRQATSPYKNCRPRLDACRYAIQPSDERCCFLYRDARPLVYSAAVVGAALKVGVGAMVMGFKSSKDVDSAAVVERTLADVTDAEAGLGLTRMLNQCLTLGDAGLSWITPFSFDARDGLTRCITAWRQYGSLLSLYNACPLAELEPCFTTGGDMSHAILGRHVVHNNECYAQLFVCSVAETQELLGMCETPTMAVLASIHGTIARLRSWLPVVRFVSFVGILPRKDGLTRSPDKWGSEELRESVASTPVDLLSSSRSDVVGASPVHAREKAGAVSASNKGSAHSKSTSPKEVVAPPIRYRKPTAATTKGGASSDESGDDSDTAPSTAVARPGGIKVQPPPVPAPRGVPVSASTSLVSKPPQQIAKRGSIASASAAGGPKVSTVAGARSRKSDEVSASGMTL